jgi:hypothetical protein
MTKQEKKPTKECPYCWEEILATAKKCKHCWEFLDDDLRAEKKNEKNTWNVVIQNATTDYTWCYVIKRWLFEWTPNVECPKCWYKWKANYQRWSYSWCLFVFLLFCWIIPWLVYYMFASSWKYVCPQCGVDHLRKTKWTIDFWWILVIVLCILFFLLPALAIRNTTNTHSSLSNMEVKPSVAEITQKRIDYVYENFWPNGVEPRVEFESMTCKWDCAFADVELKLNAEPKDLDVDTIARWQTLNLAKELKKEIWEDIAAYVSVFVKWVERERCRWLWNEVDKTFWKNWCEVY